MPNLSTDHRHEMNAALFVGKKIQAIKVYRQATGQGLKESKDFVEALERQLRAEMPENFETPPAKAGCAGLFLFLLGLGYLGIKAAWEIVSAS